MITYTKKSNNGRNVTLIIENDLQDFIVNGMLNITSDKVDDGILSYLELVETVSEHSIVSVRICDFKAVEFKRPEESEWLSL